MMDTLRIFAGFFAAAAVFLVGMFLLGLLVFGMFLVGKKLMRLAK